MTAFTTADLPTNIDTVEKLAVWVSMVLNNINLQKTVQEVAGTSQPVAVSQLFVYNDNGTIKHRYVGRISVDISADYQQGTTKLWTHAQALSATATPTGFKS